MKTSPSNEDPGGELIPAVSTEIQERDPGLVSLVRHMVSLELRLQELPNRPGEPLEEEELILADMEELDQELRRYTAEMAVAKKVDRFTSMLAYLQWQREALTQEIRRLTDRKHSAQASIKRMLDAAQYALNLLPQPRYGVRELEGASSSLALVKNPGRVKVVDQATVPPVFRQATIKMNLQLWLDLVQILPPEKLHNQFTVSDTVTLSDLAQVLKTGVEIPGVEWVHDSRVERR